LYNVTMLAGIVAGLSLTSPASATLLSNGIQFPLLSFDNGGVTSYDASTDAFSVNANPIAIRLAPGDAPKFITPNPPDAGELFAINISVDDAGNLIGGSAGDDLMVVGFIDFDGDGTPDIGGVLLTGEVTGFGSQESGATDNFDFAFNVTGGGLAGLFPTGIVGVTMHSERSLFNGSFAESFAGGAKGTLGTIPEPTTLLLLGSGVAGIAVAGRRRAA
jgi:hypothetical protein